MSRARDGRTASRVAIYGTGKSAREVARACEARPDAEVVAVVTHSEAKVGRGAGEVLGIEGLPIAVVGDIDAVPESADVLVHTGLGSAAERAELLGRAADRGLSSITVTGLIHPPTALGAEAAAALDARARAGEARIVGTGVNPGLLLDVLPGLWLTMSVDRAPVKARRVSDVREWGDGALEREIRLGADPAAVGENRTLSLSESVALLGEAAGVSLDRVEDEYEPLSTPTRRSHGSRVVEPGQVVGFHRRGVGTIGSRVLFEVEWIAIFCLEAEVDGYEEEAVVEVGGESWIRATAAGQFLRDPYASTAARALNAIEPLFSKPPGLWRPDQLPLSR